MGCTERIARRFPVIGQVQTKFTSIFRAICETQTVTHMSDGFSRFFSLRSFFSRPNAAPQTTAIVRQSAVMNGLKYLVPVIMYQRGVNVLQQYYLPQSLSNVLSYADTLIWITLLARLFARRFKNNTIDSVSLPRAVSNDMPQFLAQEVSDHLANVISIFLLEVFGLQDRRRITYNNLLAEFNKIFDSFFKKKNISRKSFLRLKNLVQSILQNEMQHCDTVGISQDGIVNFSEALASFICEELKSATFSSPLKKPEGWYEVKFQRILQKLNDEKMAGVRAEQWMKNFSVVRNQFKRILPITSYQPCKNCDFKKTTQAIASSPLYFSGHIGLTYFPEFVEWMGFTPKSLVYWKMFSWALRAFLYGQSLYEAKISSAGKCTRHRYLLGSANKAYLFGAGMSLLLTTESSVLAVKWLTGIDTFFSRNALASFFLLLHSIPPFVFNDPLPGTNKRAWDIFWPTRKLIFYTSMFFKKWLAPDLNKMIAQKEFINNLQEKISSKEFIIFNYMMFGESEFIPLVEFQNVRKFLADPMDANKFELVADSKQFSDLTDHEKRYYKQLREKLNPLTVLYENPSMRILFRLYLNEIASGVSLVKLFHSMSLLLNTPLSILPVPGAIISFIVMPLQFLSIEGWENIIKQTQLHLKEAGYLQSISDDPTDDPGEQAHWSSSVIMVDDSKREASLKETSHLRPLELGEPTSIRSPIKGPEESKRKIPSLENGPDELEDFEMIDNPFPLDRLQHSREIDLNIKEKYEAPESPGPEIKPFTVIENHFSQVDERSIAVLPRVNMWISPSHLTPSPQMVLPRPKEQSPPGIIQGLR